MTDGRVSRNAAMLDVKAIIRKAKEVNDDISYVYRISRMVVYGAFVDRPEDRDYKTLDIGYLLLPKYEGEEHDARLEATRDGCPLREIFTFDNLTDHAGERWYDDLDPDVRRYVKYNQTTSGFTWIRANWPRLEVTSHLRMRKYHIILHDIEEEGDRIFAHDWLELDLIGDAVLLEYDRWPREVRHV